MLDSQNSTYKIMVLPQTLGTTSVTGRVDTLGYDHLEVIYVGDTAVSTDVITTMKLSYGDTTSAFTDIAAATGGTGFTIPAPNTSTGDIVLFDVSKANIPRRYFQLTLVSDATTRLTNVIARLSRAKTLPDTDAERGAAEVVYI